MYDRLEDTHEELRAGRLAGNILVSEYHKREKLFDAVPPRLKERVKGIIAYYDDIEIKRLSEEIADLKTREERNIALQKVPLHIRRAVKEIVIEFFGKNRENAMD